MIALKVMNHIFDIRRIGNDINIGECFERCKVRRHRTLPQRHNVIIICIQVANDLEPSLLIDCLPLDVLAQVSGNKQVNQSLEKAVWTTPCKFIVLTRKTACQLLDKIHS